MKNVVSVTAGICDMEPHFLKLWDAEDVRDPLLVERTVKRTKNSPLVGGSGTCIEIPKYPDVYFS